MNPVALRNKLNLVNNEINRLKEQSILQIKVADIPNQEKIRLLTELRLMDVHWYLSYPNELRVIFERLFEWRDKHDTIYFGEAIDIVMELDEDPIIVSEDKSWDTASKSYRITNIKYKTKEEIIDILTNYCFTHNIIGFKYDW
jgi:hypothetical protein